MDNNINQAYRDLITQMVEIRQFIRKEHIENRVVTVEQAKEKWPKFAEERKPLLKQCVSKEMDFNKMVYMFRLKTLVDEGKVSEYDASVVHGKMVYDSYIKK